MAFRLAGMVGRGLKNWADKLEMIKSFPLIEISLLEELEYYRNLNYRDEALIPLVYQQWLNDTIFPENISPQLFNLVRWYDLRLFKLAIIPYSTILTNYNFYFRVLTLGAVNSQPLSLKVYKKDQEDDFWPGIMNRQENLSLDIAPNRIGIRDFKVDGNPFLVKNITMMFGIDEEKVLTYRVKIHSEGKGKLAKTYEDIITKSFYELVNLPYMTPAGSESLVYHIHLGHSRKIRNKKLVELNLEKFVKQEQNPQWLQDYTNLSPYWGK